jgi:hypothetical protein
MTFPESHVEDPTWLFGFATNLRASETGLTKIVLVSNATDQGGPRIKIGTRPDSLRSAGWATMTIADDPQVIGDIPSEITQHDIELAKSWIVKNKTVLLQYWNDEFDTPGLIKRLQKV